MIHLETPLIVDLIIGAICAAVLAMMFVREDLLQKIRLPVIVFWIVTGVLNLYAGIIPLLPNINWLCVLYLLASIAGVIVAVKKKP